MSPHFNSLLDEQIGARTLIAFSGFYISESEVSFLEAGLSWTNVTSQYLKLVLRWANGRLDISYGDAESPIYDFGPAAGQRSSAGVDKIRHQNFAFCPIIRTKDIRRPTPIYQQRRHYKKSVIHIKHKTLINYDTATMKRFRMKGSSTIFKIPSV